MADKPIIFSAPMVRALLDGRKTQTRRVLKPPYGTLEYLRDGTWRPICTKFFKGDRLYVREAHYITDDGDSGYAAFAEDQEGVAAHFAEMQTLMASYPNIDWSKHLRLRPSIHMPRWASRLTLIVTDVRVQRLHEISEADAVAEGIDRHGDRFSGYGKASDQWMGAIDSFASLWISIHGTEAWDANPWVCAITFTAHRCNIDQMEADHG